MKKIIFLFVTLILSACTSQVTVTSQMTVTLPAPTETPILTPTLSPQFNSLQQQIATSQNYTLTQNGDIEFKTEEGVIIVPDIKASKENGEIIFTENEEKFKIDPASISFDEDRFLFTVVDGDAWVFNGMALMLQETQAKFDQAGVDINNRHYRK